MQALVDYEAALCECGIHESVANEDEDPDLELVARRCPYCAERDRGLRMLAARDAEELKAAYGNQDPPPAAVQPDDGRHLGIKRKPPTPSPER